MTYQSTTEYVRISLSADVATAHCAGSTIPLSKDVIYRSSLLNQALAEATDQDEVSLSLPKGVLAAWQQGLKLIDIDPGPPTTAESAERRVAAFDHRRKCGSKGMFESIWAADFLDDADSLLRLCRMVSTEMFGQYIDMGEITIDEQLAKELYDLPNNLQHSFLAACQVPLPVQLSLLPCNLHRTALLAAFPSITSKASIIIPHTWCSGQKFLKPLWVVLGKETAIKHLTCSSELRGTHDCTGLLSSVAKFTGLESLNLSGLCLGHSHMQQVSDCIVKQRGLAYLNLSRNQISGNAVLGLSSALLEATALLHLDISDNRFAHLGPALSDLSSLEVLNMGNCGAEMGGYPLKHLPNASSLKELRYSGNMFDTCILQNLRGFLGLRHLELPEVSSDPDTAVHWHDVAPVLSTLTDLEVLHLPKRKLVPNEGLQRIANSITALSKLRVLSVHVRRCTPEGAVALGKLITALPCLEDLDISDTPLSRREPSTGAIILAPYLSKVQTLKRVTLRQTVLKERGLEALAPSMNALTELEVLNLSRNDVRGEDSAVLKDILAHQRGLQTLNLSHNQLEDETFPPIAETIGNMHGLQMLWLQCNNLALHGMTALSRHLSSLTCLTELDLMGNLIGPVSPGAVTQHLVCFQTFAQNLGSLRALQILNLSDTALGDEGMRALAPAISKLTALRKISLFKNYLTFGSIQSGVMYLTNLVALETFDLGFNHIRHAGVQEVVRCVRSLPSLHSVDLQRNQITCVDHLVSDPYLSLLLSGLDDQLNPGS